MNHNILHIIIRKSMQQNPHPLARIMQPLLDDIDNIYEQTSNKNDFQMVKSLVSQIEEKYFKRSLYIYYLMYIIHGDLLVKISSICYPNQPTCSIDIVYTTKMNHETMEIYVMSMGDEYYIIFESAITNMSIYKYLHH